MVLQDIIIYILLALGASYSLSKNKLNLPGTITGLIVGLIIYEGCGLTGFTMLTLFFFAGSWATSWRKNLKNINEATQPRTTWQVLANAGVAAVLGIIAIVKPDLSPLLLVMMAGSFASAAADTLSSELGMIYGKRFFNIVTFKKDQRGFDGVISVEGTLIGIAGAALIAITYILFNGFSMAVPVIILAGFVGNLMDSVLGAVFERKNLMGNNTVNLLNTHAGALMCYIMA